MLINPERNGYRRNFLLPRARGGSGLFAKRNGQAKSGHKLRRYQQAAIVAAMKAEARGLRNQLIVLPAGTGKTVIFAELARLRASKGRTLVLAHRDELINQAVAKILSADPTAIVGVVKGQSNELDAPIVVASVQTLSRHNRLRKLGRDFATTIVSRRKTIFFQTCSSTPPSPLSAVAVKPSVRGPRPSKHPKCLRIFRYEGAIA